MTCSSCPGSARIGPRLRPCFTTSSTVSPSKRFNRWDTSETTSGSWSTCGRRVCWREKASNCRVRPAARFEFDAAPLHSDCSNLKELLETVSTKNDTDLTQWLFDVEGKSEVLFATMDISKPDDDDVTIGEYLKNKPWKYSEHIESLCNILRFASGLKFIQVDGSTKFGNNKDNRDMFPRDSLLTMNNVKLLATLWLEFPEFAHRHLRPELGNVACYHQYSSEEELVELFHPDKQWSMPRHPSYVKTKEEFARNFYHRFLLNVGPTLMRYVSWDKFGKGGIRLCGGAVLDALHAEIPTHSYLSDCDFNIFCKEASDVAIIGNQFLQQLSMGVHDATQGKSKMYIARKGACFCIWIEDFQRMFQLIFFGDHNEYNIINRFDHRACQVLFDGVNIKTKAEYFHDVFTNHTTRTIRNSTQEHITAHRAIKMERKGYQVVGGNAMTDKTRLEYEKLSKDEEWMKEPSFPSSSKTIEENIALLDQILGGGAIKAQLYNPVDDVLTFENSTHDINPDCSSCICSVCSGRTGLMAHQDSA